MLRLRREKRSRILASTFAMLAVTFAVIAGSLVHSSIQSNASSSFKYYTKVTVESGETIWGLADSYIDYEHYKDKSRYVAEIRSINHLDEDCTIMAGQILILPYYSDAYVK